MAAKANNVTPHRQPEHAGEPAADSQVHDHLGTNEPADPVPRGIWPTAKQSFKDLFIWKQRTEIINEYGDARYEWWAAPPVQNPIKLIMQLNAKQWLFFLVGLFSWLADAFDFHALSIQTVKLAAYFDQSKTNITTAITLTLLFRSVVRIFPRPLVAS